MGWGKSEEEGGRDLDWHRGRSGATGQAWHGMVMAQAATEEHQPSHSSSSTPASTCLPASKGPCQMPNALPVH